MSDYEKCKKSGHDWRLYNMGDEPENFADFPVEFECVVCEARAEGNLDVRTDDGLFLEWVA